MTDQIVQSAYAKMARMDVPRGVPRVRVRVVCTPTMHVVAGHVFERGENIVTVYEDQVPALNALVEKLERHHERLVAEQYERATELWKTENKGSDSTSPHSREGFIRQVTGRDPLPFVSVEVLGVEGGAKSESKGKDA